MLFRVLDTIPNPPSVGIRKNPTATTKKRSLSQAITLLVGKEKDSLRPWL